MITHAWEEGVVVFNIGTTVHKLHRVDQWVPVFRAMSRMLRELYEVKAAAEKGEAEDTGFLGAVTTFGLGGPWVTQYWRTPEQLYAYASKPDLVHLPAWRAFNRAARKVPGAVSIWHETYVVPAGNIETIYSDRGAVGLGKFTGTVPLTKRGQTAKERLGTTKPKE